MVHIVVVCSFIILSIIGIKCLTALHTNDVLQNSTAMGGMPLALIRCNRTTSIQYNKNTKAKVNYVLSSMQGTLSNAN